MAVVTSYLMVLAFTLLPPPAPAPVPEPISPEVQAVQRAHGIVPLEIPAKGVDPVKAGLIPADIEAETQRKRDEMDRASAALFEKVTGRPPKGPPVKLWKETVTDPDLSLTGPPQPCDKKLAGFHYIDMALRSVCVCSKGRWCPVGKMPKAPCAGTASVCQ